MQLRYTQESDFRRERDFGQKISATFEFIRAHWRPLGRVLLYLVLPAALLQCILSALMQLQMRDTVQNLGTGQGTGLGRVFRLQGNLIGALAGTPAYWLNSLVGAAFFTLLVLSVYGYLVQYLHRRTPGAEVTVAEVWAGVRRGFFGTFFSMWGVGILIGIGFLFLGLPGMYLSVAFSLFFIVKAAEGTSFSATCNRCLRLTRGKWWSTFGVIFIMMVMFYMVLFGLGVVVTIVSGGLSAVVHATREQSPMYTIVVASLSSLAMLLLYPPLLLALAFQYFNLVERQEGVGLRGLINQIGQAPAAVHNATYQADEQGEY